MTERSLQTMRDKALETGVIDGHEYMIIEASMDGALNGYVVFKKRPTIETEYDGILSYVPVHGGITYCNQFDDGMMYGFDTLHYNSEQYPRRDKKWIKEQIEIMLKGIKLASKVERNYLRAITNKGKAKWAQMVQDVQPEHAHNFSVSINLLSGKL